MLSFQKLTVLLNLILQAIAVLLESSCTSPQPDQICLLLFNSFLNFSTVLLSFTLRLPIEFYAMSRVLLVKDYFFHLLILFILKPSLIQIGHLALTLAAQSPVIVSSSVVHWFPRSLRSNILFLVLQRKQSTVLLLPLPVRFNGLHTYFTTFTLIQDLPLFTLIIIQQLKLLKIPFFMNGRNTSRLIITL